VKKLAPALALLVAGVLAVAPARADDEEEARAAMRRGVTAFGRGDAVQALTEYETAKRLAPRANAPHLYAAEARVALGRYAEAIVDLEAYLAKNPNVSDAADVRARIAKLRAEHLPARVKVVADAPDATLVIDGTDSGVPREVAIAPGRHRLEVRAPSREPVARDVEVVGDTDATFVFSLPRALALEPAAALRPAAPGSQTSGPLSTIGWVAFGVGAATLGAAFVIDAAALGPAVSEYRAAADRGDAAARELRDDASSLRAATVTGYVAGGVLAVGGLALVLFAPRTAQSSDSRNGAGRIVPHASGVTVTF